MLSICNGFLAEITRKTGKKRKEKKKEKEKVIVGQAMPTFFQACLKNIKYFMTVFLNLN